LKRKKGAAAYLKQFKERRAALWAREQAPDDYHATVATTWEMAFEHARKTRGAADLLNLCCFLAPDNIPLATIQEQAGALPETLAAVLADEDAREDTLAALSDYSLLTAADGTLNVHRLVQAVGRERMGAERARTWAEAAVNLLVKAYNFDFHDMRTWAGSGQLLPHVIAAANLAAEWAVNSERVAYLNNHAGFYLYNFGDYAGARPYYERALAIREAQLGPGHPDTAVSLNNLGELLRAMGAYGEARPYYERALAIWEEQLGPDHPQTAAGNNNLGALLQAMGEYGEARPYYERALAIFEKKLGSDHPDVDP
ncbi:MAG: tetratricopeptide repeat protein, partial [Chloroflexi bacterium]|nr:tetratricopeptide repeat protein [Chloroflexota bacterium]